MKMKNKRFNVLLLFLACSLVLLGGCGSSGEPSGTGSREDPQTEETEGQEEQEEQVSLGEFFVEDIYGETYTQEMFAEYQLTMVNVFATWCSPCINEIPDLETLKNEMAGQQVALVGIVLDTAGEDGNADPEALEKARTLAETLGVTYPFLVPDAGYLNGLLLGISAVPTTFFVDQEGNLVGKVYLGSHSLEEWRGIVAAELEGVAQ